MVYRELKILSVVAIFFIIGGVLAWVTNLKLTGGRSYVVEQMEKSNSLLAGV